MLKKLINTLILVCCLCFTFGCNSPYTPSGFEENIPKHRDYEAVLVTPTALIKQEVIINGKNFGNHNTAVAIYLDSVRIVPNIVKDTVIVFRVPSNVVYKKYTILVQILDDTVEVSGVLNVVKSMFDRFTSIGVVCNLNGKYRSRKDNQTTTYVGLVKFTFDTYPCKNAVGYIPFEIGSVGAVFRDSCSTSSSYYYNKRDYGSSSSLRLFKAVFDTVNKVVKDIVIHDGDLSSSFVYPYGTVSRKKTSGVKLSKASYKVVEEGVEIYVEGSDLKNELLSVFYIDDPGENNYEESSYNFELTPIYDKETFIRIVLKTK